MGQGVLIEGEEDGMVNPEYLGSVDGFNGAFPLVVFDGGTVHGERGDYRDEMVDGCALVDKTGDGATDLGLAVVWVSDDDHDTGVVKH